VSELIAPNGKITIDCEPGQVSDGYHTFDELYEHRCLLFAAWCRWMPETFKTRKNDKGEELQGWFIAGFNTPWGQVTYHLPDSIWDLVDAFEIDRNFDYDGHTSQDVAQRLRKMLEADWV
jgi:hypothetical protein